MEFTKKVFFEDVVAEFKKEFGENFERISLDFNEWQSVQVRAERNGVIIFEKNFEFSIFADLKRNALEVCEDIADEVNEAYCYHERKENPYIPESEDEEDNISPDFISNFLNQFD